LIAVAVLSPSLAAVPSASPDELVQEGVWTVTRDEASGVALRTMELTLHPQPEPRPALKYLLIADEFARVDGNAAVYYLKAMGFLEQNTARDWLSDFTKKSAEQVRTEGKGWEDAPPYSWQNMLPNKLPLDEVKQFLQVSAFQPPLLREAARRRQFDLDRQIRSVENPIGYLLPEMQTMRELARTQRLRCRVAIAENRIDDALTILGQQYAMAWHLGQDEFFVPTLVGAACAGIAWEDMLLLVQHADTPNLYWALATLPRPLIDMQRANAYEREFLYEQVKVLREVDETPRPAGYWSDFVSRLLPQIEVLAGDFGLPRAWSDPDLKRVAVVAYIALAYPGARHYLIQECGLSPEQVDAYPTAQTVFLAIVRYYDATRDEYFKWTFLPFWQAVSAKPGPRMGEAEDAAKQEFGFCTLPTGMFLPATLAAGTAAARVQQQLALVQTVEAVRLYAGDHDGQFPPTLAALSLPAPPDPFTGQPVAYELHGDHAVLTGHPLPGMQYRLVLRWAEDRE
jgi:hypothetical protein